MKIFCLNKISNLALKNLDLDDYIVENIEEADAIIVRSYNMLDMDLPKNILMVVRAGAGTNNIPVEKYSKKGIVVFNTPGANANAVKELVICSLLLSCRGIIDGIEWVRNNSKNKDIKELTEKEKSKFAGSELMNKKIGIIGLGGIGVLVANTCYSLGMEVYGYDPFISINNAMLLSRNIIYVKKIEEICNNCDFISIHVPYNTNTNSMFSNSFFEEMKKNTTLLNFSRGELIKTELLKDAISKGIINKYITDFPNYDIIGLDNVIITPHLGASTKEAEDNCAVMAISQAKKFYTYGGIKNSINYPDTDVEVNRSNFRLVINHENTIGMINKFTEYIVKDNGNISNMINKSKSEQAYTILDIDCNNIKEIEEDIKNIKGVYKTRIIL